ncbi:MAG: phosphoribosylglycinamide formyltransferase [Pseudomonadota bacterium]
MQPDTRIVVLISGSGSNLQALLDQSKSTAFPGSIVGVISDQPDAFGLQRAADSDVPTTVVERSDFDSRDAFDAALARAVIDFDPDLIVLAGFMRIIRGALIDQFAGRMLNIHPALLPKYKGLNTHERCLENGDVSHGTTVHFVSAELDAGPSVIQAQLIVSPADTAQTLTSRVQAMEHVIYPIAVRWLAEGRLRCEGDRVFMDGEPLNEPVIASDHDLLS